MLILKKIKDWYIRTSISDMKYTLFLFFNLLIFSAYAGKESNTTGARSSALAGSSILLNDFWSAENNPAGLGFVDNWSAGISYENHFLLSEMAYKSAVLAYPTESGAFGLSVGQFGYSLYQENKIGLSYGQRLSKTFSLGVQLNYLNTNIAEGYGSRSGISANVGLMADLSDEIRIAAVVINPNRTKINDFNDERLPTLIKLGFGYQFSKKVQFVSEIEKDIDFDANGKFGIEYLASERFYVRVGYGTDPSLSSFGFGLRFKDFTLDASSNFHSSIGFTPQISISFTPQKAKSNDQVMD